jgi:hypothetical protein
MSYCANISKFQTNTIPLTHKYITTHLTGLVQAFQEKKPNFMDQTLSSFKDINVI